IVGAIAKFLMPGPHPGGIFITMLLGEAGSGVGGYIANALGFAGGTGFIGSVLGAMLILFIYRLVRKKS
ncbi:MAG: GlsB/YeaQ/YmgE family stress response membrane protein, partial [Burkholderiales bacterium]